MMRFPRKRALEQDVGEERTKFARLNSSAKFGSGILMQSLHDIPSPKHAVHSENTLSSLLNASTPANTPSSAKFADKIQSNSRDIKNRSHRLASTYQPLDEYRKAEALRLVFLKHGLSYKRPRADLSLLAEHNLTDYIAQWEDCLAHWHAIIGDEPLTETERVKADERCESLRYQFGVFPHTIGPKPLGEESSHGSHLQHEVPIAESSNTSETSLSPHFSCSRPWSVEDPSRPTIARWPITGNIHTNPWKADQDQLLLRQMVQCEVQNQLDKMGFGTRPGAKFGEQLLLNQSNISPPVDAPSIYTDLTSCSHDYFENETLTSEPCNPDQNQSPDNVDMVPVKQLTDGTIIHLDTEDRQIDQDNILTSSN